jgi:hypothetical protein
MTRYYDLILGSIPIVQLGIPSVFHLVGYPVTAGILLGGVTAACLVGHALFVRSPTDPSSTPVDDQQGASTSDGPVQTVSD